MVNDGWSYVHSADVAEARDILVRKVRWETAANFGAAVIVLAVVTLALVVWL